MYASPVIYSVDMVPAKYLTLYLLNPMAVFIELFRSGVMSTEFIIPMHSIAIAVVLTVVIFVFGIGVFARWQAQVVKYL